MTQHDTTQPIAETINGPVLGKEKAGLLLFCGIPYAAPPVGEMRFKRVQPAEPWHDLRDCTRFGPAAPQLPSGGMTDTVPVKWDEDCLSLNVCTPAIDGQRRPVMVWIHGGAYRSGQGAVPWYNGASFAKSDIVVVSINYRLGALGFTDLSRFGEDYATSGINGVLDQIAALEWVRDNIAGFGGDPQQVTIAGESAGGFSVATLLGSPRAQGLFQRAIPQSGAAHDTLTREVGARVADLLLEELQVDSMAALQAKSPLDILDAQNRADARYYKEGIGNGVMAFYPVEGDNEVLPEPLQTHLAAGVGADIPVLTGTNKDEATLFIMKKVSEESLLRQATGYGGGERLVNAYRQLYPDASTTDISIKLSTDFTFKIPALRLAELRASLGANTWLYQFDWESRAPHLKATHALEIPFTFNTLGSAGVDIFIGEGELPQALADEMHQVWTDFIRGDSPGWPAYELDKRAVKHFNTQSSLVEDGYADINAAWEGIR